MPPKKGKKKTPKADLEARRVSEEEENLRRDELAVQIERERSLSVQQEKDATERRVVSRNAEVARLTETAGEMRDILETRRSRSEEEGRAREGADEWDAYIGCNDAVWPDADDPRSLNTFLSEAPVSCNLGRAVEFGETIGRVFGDIESRSRGPGDGEKLTEFVPRLRFSLMERLDCVSSEILQQYNRFTTSDPDGNLRVTAKGFGGMNVALWAARPGNTDIKKASKTKRLDFQTELGFLVDLPKNLGLGGVLQAAVRVVRIPFNIKASLCGTDGSDSDYIVLGGSLLIDLLIMPPVHKQMEGWRIRTIPDSSHNTPLKLNYPLGSPMGSFTLNAAPFKCQMKIHNVIVPPNPQLAWWSDKEQNWNLDAVSDGGYDAENGTISFSAYGIGSPISLIQSRIADFCYQDWSLGPATAKYNEQENTVLENAVRFSITTPRFVVTIQVEGNMCGLLSPEIPQLEHLRGKKLSPEDMLLALRKSGINLTPADSDAKRINNSKGEETVTFKNKCLEDQVYADLSYLSTSFISRASNFNRNLGENKACYQIKESDIFTGGCDTFDMHIAVTEMDSESSSKKNAPGAELLPPVCNDVKTSLVGIVGHGSDSELDVASLDGERSQSFAVQCMEPFCTPEAIDRVRRACPVVTETVRELLELTRPINLC